MGDLPPVAIGVSDGHRPTSVKPRISACFGDKRSWAKRGCLVEIRWGGIT